MHLNPRLDVLPKAHVRVIVPGAESTQVTATFDRPEHVSVDDRGWLFVSETESAIGDILTIESDRVVIAVASWSMTPHVHVDAVLPWLDGNWQAGDLAFLLDDSREWRRVRHRASDGVVFAQLTLRCDQCQWTGDAALKLSACPNCAAKLSPSESVGEQEAGLPLDADQRLVEVRKDSWDHDHCLICNAAIGRDEPWGYRESSFADGPNSVGLWFCERCFERYVSRRDFSFLARP